MATSNSFDFNLNTIQIIEAALRKVGGLEDGQTPINEQVTNTKIELNAMVKAWRADNIFLWREVFLTVPIRDSSVVNDGGLDYECIRNHTSDTDNKPTGSKGATFWKALTTTAGSAWVTATDYVSISNYFLDSQIVDITRGRVRDIDTNNTRPLTKITQDMFFNLSDPTTTGEPDQFYFRRDFTPEIFLYPVPEDSTSFVLEFWTWQYPQDFDDNDDDPDFLQDWLEALIDGLAVRLAPSNGIFGSQLRDLQNIASLSKNRAMKLDHETGDLRVAPNFRNGD